MNLNDVELLEYYDELHPEGAGTTPAEKLLLFSLCALLRPTKVIEIGCCAGHSTAWLALGVQQCGGQLISVDNFSKTYGGTTDSPKIAIERLKVNGLLGLVTIVQSDSVEFMEQQPDNSAEIVWVDGDHSYKGAFMDIMQALRVASKFVIVHDVCHEAFDSVRRACETIGGGVFLNADRGLWLRDTKHD